VYVRPINLFTGVNFRNANAQIFTKLGSHLLSHQRYQNDNSVIVELLSKVMFNETLEVAQNSAHKLDSIVL
jgi:hypothetical protein